MATPKTLATTFLLLFVAAAAYPTTITTVDMVEAGKENPGQPQEQRCREQIQSQHQLNACQQYLRESSRIMRRQGETILNESGWREQFPRCCEQLEQLEEQCRCEGIRGVVHHQLQHPGDLQGVEMQEMLQTAESLPSLCRISSRRCDVRSLLLWF